MDEFNLAARFAEDEDEAPSRGRGRIKRLRRGRTGVGLEKPVGHGRQFGEGEVEVRKTERVDPSDFGGEDSVAPEGSDDSLPMLIGEDEEGHQMFENRRSRPLAARGDVDEDDDAFRDLVDRMEGGSASAGRAAAKRAKMKGKRPAPRRPEPEEE